MAEVIHLFVVHRKILIAEFLHPQHASQTDQTPVTGLASHFLLPLSNIISYSGFGTPSIIS